MLTTDYSGIAARYDRNPIRSAIPRDPLIESLHARGHGGFRVLDLACGTGNYLRKQIECYGDLDVEWHGLDRSPEMLEQAKAKGLKAALVNADALKMPYRDAMFDYVKLRFAYHHFADKKRAFGEIRRVLKPHGVLSIQNLSHDYMRNSWVYRYFPSSAAIDRERFLDTDALIGMLRELGFSVSAAINVRIEELAYRDILHEARNRDMSQLTLIPEEEYQAGLRRIEADAQKAEAVSADIALLDMTCARRGEPDRYR